MHLSNGFGLVAILYGVQVAWAADFLRMDSLVSCAPNTQVKASLFSATYTPGNKSATAGFSVDTSIDGYVNVDVDLIVYGYKAKTLHKTGCDFHLQSLCPMKPGPQKLPMGALDINSDMTTSIPNIAYTTPDIDALVRLHLSDRDSGKSYGCLESRLTNSKTVNQAGVSWALAVILGLGFVVSGVISLLGHTNTATHLAFRSLAFLSFMQTQALFGMSAVELPPIVQGWTQVFQWTMGIIHTDALQTISTWYQRSTGGHADDLLQNLETTSVNVMKRSYLDDSGQGQVTLRGIERVGFKASIEASNIFMTSYLFFYFVVLVVLICVALVRFGLPVLAKKSPKVDRAISDTTEWKAVTRGTLFRLVSMGYPPMCVLCLWELTQKDSPGEILVAIVMWLILSALMGWATFQVFKRGLRSKSMHNSPAYMLYSDPACLKKWGFLYVYYRAPAFYFTAAALAYTVIKCMVLAFGQSSPIAQAVVILILEIAMLVAISIIKPYMNKPTNIFAIVAATINFLNAIFLLIFTNVFNQPELMTGVMGVLFFIYNAIFTLILLCFVLVGLFFALTHKQPDSKYQPLADDRGSFRLSSGGGRMTTELESLEKVARGDGSHPGSRDGYSSHSRVESVDDFGMGTRSPTRSPYRPYRGDVVDPSVPLVPSHENVARRF
ncbi:hypothetical protein NUU61_008726 [Penicillium alfredii]|uniref:ML-like domain-containing protein n=1 Tax=Penicillium alfredii TaxID=1506179 RepID=A0A9W9ELN7_9EURO|nr:uncharacterized protein NUU61_008726 [Penicillium alfredii]KAJ5084147.1 hypothetical protein NUU61_008726 [Penicillium alfredii]